MKIIDDEMLQELRNMQSETAPQFVFDILSAFLDAGVGCVSRMGQALAHLDGSGVASEAHALKSSCLNLGAERLGHLLNEVEKLGKAGALPEVAARYPRVQSEFNQLQKAVHALPEFQKKSA